MDVSEFFKDDQEEDLTYAVICSRNDATVDCTDNSFATVTIEVDELVMNPKRGGVVDITVRAIDKNRSWEEQSSD